MTSKKKSPQYSIYISDCCQMFTDAIHDYEWHSQEVNRLDKLTQDYLHMLELDGLDYKERAKVATQISKCRKQRRESKDIVMNLAPLVEFLDSEKGKNMVNLMRETLGKTRKVEKQMENRIYIPRVLGNDESNNGT